MSERAERLQQLRDVHAFPGPFVFKVIGANSPEFTAQVLQAMVVVLGPRSQPDVAIRPSSRGNHQALTLRVQVPNAESVLDVYDALKTVQGVRILL